MKPPFSHQHKIMLRATDDVLMHVLTQTNMSCDFVSVLTPLGSGNQWTLNQQLAQVMHDINIIMNLGTIPQLYCNNNIAAKICNNRNLNWNYYHSTCIHTSGIVKGWHWMKPKAAIQRPGYDQPNAVANLPESDSIHIRWGQYFFNDNYSSIKPVNELTTHQRYSR